MKKTALAFSEEGKEAFEKGDFENAIQSFSDAAKNYEIEGKPLNAAEERNNLSVALLQAERAKEALEAAEGTDTVFAEAGDKLKQAMSIGNQAAAFDGLGDLDKAIALYQQSASLFAEIGEGDYQETVLKSIAAIELRSGKLQNSTQTMLASLLATKKPNLFQRFLKFILRIVQR